MKQMCVVLERADIAATKRTSPSFERAKGCLKVVGEEASKSKTAAGSSSAHLDGAERQKTPKKQLSVSVQRAKLISRLRTPTKQNPLPLDKAESAKPRNPLTKICQQSSCETPRKKSAETSTCAYCGKELLSRNLSRHLMLHKNGYKEQCAICHKRLKSFQNLRSICPFTSKLQEHMRTHRIKKRAGQTASVRIRLNACSLTAERKKALERSLKSLRCQVCRKQFRDADKLDFHLFLHKKKNVLDCSECGKSFPTRSGLQRHMISHTGEKPFSCSVCGKKYRDKRDLLFHSTKCGQN
ncbi:hypothetical protein WMY93_026374 [Mugilogobius chulae]|uniref:C2H2-type domain-containing protein n=1 Tax=Mugilogobius chulae TaxID=88201 RepID=A0AAW0N7A5_9GOBI